MPQQSFQSDPNAPPQFQRIQIQQAAGQKPMPQPNMVVPVQKPFVENADQVRENIELYRLLNLLAFLRISS